MTTANGTLTMHCDVCDEPVVGELGYITIDIEAVKEREREAVQRKIQNRRGVVYPQIIHAAERRRPRLAPWRIYHRGCDPNPDANSYEFDVYRCCTERDLLGWTAHLLEKEWLKHTDWRIFIHGVLQANGWEDTPD